MQENSSDSAKHEPLLNLARAAMQRSYSPYSQFKVGAVVVTPKGDTFCACNVENASYPEGTCAEAGAIAAMVMAGQQHIQAIYVMGEGDALVSPCGGCRQRIREFADPQTMVHICNPQGIRKSMRLDDLLPLSFGPEHLRSRAPAGPR